MSDRPLFQNTDEQEAAYAGESGEAADDSGAVIIPGAAAAGGALSGQLATSGATGMAPAAGPVIAGINRSPGEDHDDDGVIEDEEARNDRS